MTTCIQYPYKFYYAPAQNIAGVACGKFIWFYWNGKLEESYLPILEAQGVWVYIGEL